MSNEKNVILIVDDMEINRVVLAETFKDNYEIIEAENGEEALKVINSNEKVAAVLLDLLMPVTMNTGTLLILPFLFISRSTSRPPITGMRRSRRTAATLSLELITFNASSPFSASMIS